MGKKMKARYLLVSAVLLMSFFMPVKKAFASGFAVNTQGAFALGQGNAVIAHTCGPSSVFFNPALISWLPGTRIEEGTTLIFSRTHFTSSLEGQGAETHNPVAFPSTFYITHEINGSFSAGLGFFSNFGLTTNWSGDWEGRYIATKSSLDAFTLNPVISYRPIPQVALAAGVDFVYLRAELDKQLNFSAFGLPDGSQSLKGHDTAAYGFNLGLAADLTRDVTLGLAYRSKIRTDISGTVENVLPAGTPPAIAALFPTTDARTSFFLPAQANLGVAYKGFKKLVIELGGRWEGWSSFKDLEIKPVLPIAGMTDIVYPENWRDAYSFDAGARYQVSRRLGISAGYILETSPVPDDTLYPSIPSASSDVYTLGADWKYRNFRFGLGYGYQHVHARAKNNLIDDNPFDGTLNAATSANGTYKTDMHLVALSAGYSF